MDLRHLCAPGSPDRENEDAAVVLDDRVAVVVDGAGLPHSLRAGCEHSVAWYSHRLADRFANHLLDHERTMTACLAAALTDVAAEHGPGCDLSLGSPSATTAALRVRGPQVEWLVLCDASVVVVTAHGTVEHCDDRLQSAMRAATTAVLTERGLDRATAMPEELLDARVRATQLTRNVPGGWWCCQDDPAAADEALTGSLRLDEVVRIAACSDGATRGHQLLDAWTLAEFADLLASPQGVLTATRTAEDEQAEWLVRSLQKPHDDLTVITLTP